MDVGSLAEWATAGVTFLATGAALATARSALADAEQRRLASDLAAEKERQRLAAMVDAWLGWDTALESGGLRLVLTNRSGAPITEVGVHVCLKGTEERVPSDQTSWTKLPAGNYVVAKSGNRWDFPRMASEADLARFSPYASTAHFRVDSFAFTDANAVRWERQGAGLLTRVS